MYRPYPYCTKKKPRLHKGCNENNSAGQFLTPQKEKHEKTELEVNDIDSVHAKILMLLAESYQTKNPDSTCYYGEKAIQFLFKERAIIPYRAVFSLVVLVGAIVKLDLVWAFADIMNGLMAFPNLVGLIGLSRVVVAETNKYLSEEINSSE